MADRRLRRRLRARLLPPLARLLAASFGLLSYTAAQRLGAGIGLLAWHLARRDRRRSLDHLTIAFPEESAARRRAIARASFRHLGITLGESLRYLYRDPREFEHRVRVEGWDEVEALRRAGRSLLLVTGHCGNWELLAVPITVRGLAVAAVARAADQPGLNDLIVELRRRYGTETVERGAPGSARQLLRVLRAGGALAMLIDQDVRVEGAWVPFFGRPAYTPLGAARFALRRGAAAVPMFIERLGDGTHLARFHPPLDLPADETAATALMTEAIEAHIRRVPEQWVWMHRRWRHQPPAPPD
jgi:Kdo2-lipid IVA lauroyltransferase/acyltransferase